MYALEKPSRFSKHNPHIARRAWNILRLALLWARKGGLFRNKHRLVINFNVFSKLTRKLIHSREPRGALAYGDHELSFDETPIFHVKMRRHSSSSLRFKLPHIPCIKPRVDFDYEEDFIDREDEVFDYRDVEEEEANGDCDEGIDSKAEEFIAKFYEQMKLQRQISYVQYNDMLKSGVAS